MKKTVEVRPGTKLWEVKVLGPSLDTGWLPSDVDVQRHHAKVPKIPKHVPPQLLVAVAFEWPGYALVSGNVAIPSDYLDDIRFEAQRVHQEQQAMYPGEDIVEVSLMCPTCNGQGAMNCEECGGNVPEDEDDECDHCEDGQVECFDCDGEAFWVIDYEPGLEHWPGPTAAWAAKQEAQRDSKED